MAKKKLRPVSPRKPKEVTDSERALKALESIAKSLKRMDERYDKYDRVALELSKFGVSNLKDIDPTLRKHITHLFNILGK